MAAVLDGGDLRLTRPPQGKTGKPGPPVHDDLLAVLDGQGRVRHEFTATAPNEVWLTDITEHPTREGKLYLRAVQDCYSNKIVGYSIDSRMKSSLAVSAIRNAIALRMAGRHDLSLRQGQSGRIQLVVATPRDRGGVRWVIDSRQRIGRCVRR